MRGVLIISMCTFKWLDIFRFIFQAPVLEREIRQGLTTPGAAAEKLLRTFFGL